MHRPQQLSVASCLGKVVCIAVDDHLRHSSLPSAEAALLRLLVISGALGLVACSHALRREEQDLGASPAEIAAGQKMAEEQCGTCHAVARDAQSPMRNAPPFSYLGRSYPVSSLAEALAEGMITGHDSMPEWELEPAEIRGLLGYIQSIQAP